ncbi:MAG: RNA polymerase sigma factor [Rubripirellula sp.]
MSDIYGPLVYRWCRRKGIQANDAADIMQHVLMAVSRNLESYKQTDQQGSFRRWLHGIASRKIVDHFRQQAGQPTHAFDNQLEHTMAPEEESTTSLVMDEEDKRLVVRRALASLREQYSETHWNAFWRTAIDGQPAPAIADELGIKPASVRQIKFRILRRLRDELAELEAFDDS